MPTKQHPFDSAWLEELTREYSTPFHIYDEKAIRANARALRDAFAWNDGFKEYFAVKAAPNPYLMKILAQEGFGSDCSSLPELFLADTVDIRGESIMFTSNDTPAVEYREAARLGAIINLDDISHIDYLEEHAGLPELVCCRYNPGPLKAGNVIIGHPEEAKYGFTREQLFEGYRILRDKGVKRFGLHTMVASNELDSDYFVETAHMLFDLIVELSEALGITFEFVNLGGGIGIPYRPEDSPVDLAALGQSIKEVYDRIIGGSDHPPLKVFLECGRMVTGPYGYLVSRVLHAKHTYKEFVGLDACMTNLMRPALYGAYHHISVAGKEDAPADHVYDVTGSLCENNDKFAIDRALPEMEPGDLVVIHDAGAHGHAMGFNYNGKLRSAELLLRENGDVVQIRRAETVDDLFATLDLNSLASFEV
ncbi:MAG: diaminopimelate decarboxylase [Kiritimatiellia bacterium]|jgi:diaminopimelate decarboxylase|nr:diaminopimelate decarboxylase [Kiritimatiellia bacterium]MDP6630554.1 diaminopimelate decarboxylase [Kiritimatiellia bacterium]MDP6811228.1 diaminopimelate decarboxylase [Kiritimatiellia bacterium]MDP7024327.1 diaminopimelate decarboxylase [Kiritimatiellia bacterium]